LTEWSATSRPEFQTRVDGERKPTRKLSDFDSEAPTHGALEASAPVTATRWITKPVAEPTLRDTVRPGDSFSGEVAAT
jgi:hypothetical protein